MRRFPFCPSFCYSLFLFCRSLLLCVPAAFFVLNVVVRLSFCSLSCAVVDGGRRGRERTTDDGRGAHTRKWDRGTCEEGQRRRARERGREREGERKRGREGERERERESGVEIGLENIILLTLLLSSQCDLDHALAHAHRRTYLSFPPPCYALLYSLSILLLNAPRSRHYYSIRIIT